MTILAAAAESTVGAMGIGDAGIIALLGYGVVFFGLILLMIVVTILGAAFSASSKKKSDKPVEVAAPAPVAQEPQLAPGTAGQLKLHDVSPKTAAMLMAIVADKMGKPLNELRFISIKEVK